MDEYEIHASYIDERTNDFIEKKSFGLARSIWLHCFDSYLSVPAIVEKYFIDRLTIQ